MLQQEGPNVTTDESQFFQSDADLAFAASRTEKQLKLEKAGNPISTSSKVLTMWMEYPRLWLGESGFIVRLLDMETKKELGVYKGHSGPVTCLARPSSDHLLSGSWDKSIRLWDLQSKKTLKVFNGHGDFVKSLVYLPKTKTFLSSSTDSTIREWDLDTEKCVFVYKGHKRGVESLVLDVDQLFFYSGSSDTSIKKWNLETKECVYTWNAHLTSIYSLYLFDETLYSVSADKEAKIWDLNQYKCVSSFAHDDFVKCILPLHEGTYVVTGCRDGNIRIFNAMVCMIYILDKL